MSDLWEQRIHQASFAGLDLDVLSVSDELSRGNAVHRFAYRDGGRVEDTGAVPRTTHCRVIFYQRDDDDDHLARFADFQAVKNQGLAGTFTHPLYGSYEAKIGEFSASAEAEPRDTILVEVTFTEDSDEPATFDIGAGSPLQTSAEAVAAAAAAYDASVLSVATRTGTPASDLSTTLGADALATVTAWETPDAAKTIRDVNLELVGVHNRIEAELSRLEVATDVKRYPILRSLSALQRSVRLAAQVFTERTPRIIELTIGAPTNLLTLVTRRFGASQAADRYDELRRLNDIRNPARIEAGTVLKAQADVSPRRLRSRT